MALRLLAVHIQTHHGKATGWRRNWETTTPSEGPSTYMMAFPISGGGAEFPYREVSGTGSNLDGDLGSFPSPEYPGYRHHIGGGKPTPLTVAPMQRVGALLCTELEAPRHRPVLRGGREEVPMAGRGVSAG